MKNLFPFLSIIGLTVFSLLLLYILWRSTGLVSAEHVDTFALISQVGFILGVAVIGFYEFRQSQKTFKELFLPSVMLISALSVMLILSVFSWRVEAYGIALFVFASLIYAFSRKTLYALNPIYYAVFLYALLRLFGTLFTSKGFHFPDNTIAYYLLPLSFCLFRLSKSTLLKVLRLFVRSIFLFLSVSIVFWFFNLLYLNETILNWFFNKLSFGSLAASDITLHWIHYRQPSYISLVILSALTSGAYLYYKKEEKSCISLPELLSLVALSLVYILSMESQVIGNKNINCL